MTDHIPAQSSDRQVLSISQLNRRARQLLEIHMPLLWVRGEISNFSRPGSGHWYLTLKDDNAQIRCAMFRGRNGLVKIQPQNGDQVLVRGRVSLYEPRGDYQFIIEHMEADGAGLLQQRYEALKARLEQEGLFDTAYKKPVAPYPQCIGVITSATGAALRDILHVCHRRYPWVKINVYTTPVQGKEAITGLIDALRLANEHNEADTLIVARGGGSIEDLWAFNEEAVARAVFDSLIPIISGVGHETDFTITDFVADLRAPTPSAAAELAGPNKAELQDRLARLRQQLALRTGLALRHKQQALEHCKKRLRTPKALLEQRAQHLDHLQIRLTQIWQRQNNDRRTQLQYLQNRLAQVHPQTRLKLYKQQNSLLEQRLKRAFDSRLNQHRQRLRALAGTLNAVSPLSTLERGYAVVRGRDEHVISSVADVKSGDELRLLLKDGSVDAVAKSIVAGAIIANDNGSQK
ncbi:MAG: exodeoxyribonuclease VII large subunit [Pseudomonadales bacterium]|nr:exodeoxyribonuclease VII large subunit [Pseudomonadales bacterium]